MKEIKLTQGRVALVDDEDYNYITQWKWRAKRSKRARGIMCFYASAWNVENGCKKEIVMHRTVLRITDPKMYTDHKDGNGLNNQRGNLRIATLSQNNANKSSLAGSTSKYLGVHWDRWGNKWKAAIKKNHRVVSLGRFINEVDAAIAYNKAAAEKHGEFARLNVIET